MDVGRVALTERLPFLRNLRFKPSAKLRNSSFNADKINYLVRFNFFVAPFLFEQATRIVDFYSPLKTLKTIGTIDHLIFAI